MSHILTLASDFIERMSNPAYGIKVNEDYSLRFATLLSSEGFDKMLREEAKEVTNPDTLTPHGWLWLLGWARSKDIELNPKLLLHLTQHWSSVFMQVLAIELATRRVEWERPNQTMSLEDFRNSWLKSLMYDCVAIDKKVHDEQNEIHTGQAENVLIALMQIGSDVTLDAASTLLNHNWPGQAKLLKFFWLRIEGLDEKTQKNWHVRLRPPKSVGKHQ